MQAVILAGGRGKRLEPLTEKIPKPLIKIGDKSILEHQILLLKKYAVREIWILSGYLGNQIERYFGNGKKWGVKIYHLIEKEPLGTAGALEQLKGLTKSDFIVLSGDVMLDIDIDRLIRFHKKNKESITTIVVHPNDHPFDSDLVEVDNNNRVISLLIRKNKTHPKNILFRNLTNAGVFTLSPKIFKYIKKNEKSDVEKDIFPGILKSEGNIYAYNTPEYIKDMGTLERLKKVRADFKSGKVQRFNKKNKRPAIFLDRDGVLNPKEEEHITKLDDFRLYPFAARAIRKINDSKYLAIVITNQPVIAKGMMTFDQLAMIHKKLETELGWQGAKIDAIYVCPHHPETGFAKEIKSLKIKCNCRKPHIGLIKRAAQDFNIDLSQSFLIGDSTVDARGAQNAGIKFVGVKTGNGLDDGQYKIYRNFKVTKNLLEAIKYII